ncbi:hypothetical protein HK101_001722 [Irineochytrium annulatum]|nr:hypothetical protein HK101_001722 [Irineochytrium annulatum]
MSSPNSSSAYDDKGCPILPPGYVINLNSTTGWTAVPAFVLAGICIIYFGVFVSNLIRANQSSAKDVYPTKTRATFIYVTSFSAFRAIGFILRGIAASADGGPKLGLYITVLVFQSLGFLPLIQLLLDTTSDWLSFVSGGNMGGLFGKIQRYLRIILIAIVCVAVTGAVWVAQAAPCLPSNTAVTIRNVSLWLIACLTWIAFLFSFRLARHPLGGTPTSYLLLVQSLLLIVRTSYSLIYYLRTDILRDETAFYLMSILPEILFAAPFLLGVMYVGEHYVVDTNAAKVDQESQAHGQQGYPMQHQGHQGQTAYY